MLSIDILGFVYNSNSYSWLCSSSIWDSSTALELALLYLISNSSIKDLVSYLTTVL
jgi:hypothetical protein